MTRREDIRNIAIIAHVDHGKTTLVDQLLRQSGTFAAHEQMEERVMDSNDLEKERGITILAKTTAIQYGDCRINIMDTPGHADFSGEVERILKMVDGVLLVVDAFEGCMPQTRFVLQKALDHELTPVVVVNKIDREMARPAEVVDDVLDLFIDLNASDEQLDFPVVYASALAGTASLEADEQQDDMSVLFDTVLDKIPAPHTDDSKPLQLQVTMLDYDDFLGRIAIGRVHRGRLHINDQVAIIAEDGSTRSVRVTRLFSFMGLKRVEVEQARAGDIVAVAGLTNIQIGETVASVNSPEPLAFLKVDEPTLKMTFRVNNSPFAGRDGAHVTSSKLKQRLFRELETDVSLRVEETDNPEAFDVSGRGELHLSILIENMRRERYEFQVSRPEVIIKDINGQRCEPVERLMVELPEEHMGNVMESLGERQAEMVNMTNNGNGHVRLEFTIPSRGLIGYRTEFLTSTKGYGILTHSFDSYQPVRQASIGERRFGALIAHQTGSARTYGLLNVEDRGVLFIEPGTEVYEGMIVGQHSRESDLVVNVCKEKAANNIRSATKEETVKLKAAKQLSLEEALEFLNDDEYCEITPNAIRLRKKYLHESERKKVEKQKKAVLDQ